MRLQSLPVRILLFSAACWLCAAAGAAQEQGSANQKPDVVRVNTSLVQTDVMVFNKQGVFVDGLKRDQFVLKVDGKPRDISFLNASWPGAETKKLNWRPRAVAQPAATLARSRSIADARSFSSLMTSTFPPEA